MPPKARITREMVIDAAFDVARRDGAENMNARTVAQKLGCSTQPVMYHFATIEDMKRAVYSKLDLYHTEYIMNIPQDGDMLGIGINYIRFAVEESNLFRFLFQSGFAVENNVLDMINSDELEPVRRAISEALGMSAEQSKAVFLSIALFAHGYASIIANNALEYDEEQVSEHLERAFRGAILAAMDDAAQEREV